MSMWKSVLMCLCVAATARAESIGSPCDGRLEGGLRLAETDGELLVVSDPSRTYGTRELVEALQHAGEEAASYSEKAFVVNNLSLERGGDMPGHAGHESGREVDVTLPSFGARSAYEHFGPNGRSRSGAVFDAQLLARFLLAMHRKAPISEMVLSAPLARKVAEEIRLQAAVPSEAWLASKFRAPRPGERPHDNHVHVRIACPRADLRCVDSCGGASR